MKILKTFYFVLLLFLVSIFFANVIRDDYVVSNSIVYIPVNGINVVENNINSYVDVYVTLDSKKEKLKLSMYTTRCNPSILLDKKIKMIKYTYNYIGIRYVLFEHVFDLYCKENTDLLK